MAGKFTPDLINDHYFQQAVSCPLKMNFMAGDESLFTEKPVYRQRNKLNLRDAVALRFSGIRNTSDSFRTAAEETSSWLRESDAVISGAVIIAGRLVTRIPILVKEGDRFVIIQIHGKLRKESERNIIDNADRKRTTATYLLKAAYRLEVLKRAYPEAEVSVQFYFPGTGFRASTDNLNRVSDYFKTKKKEKLADLNRLFSSVDATPGTLKVHASIPGSVSHSLFSEQPVKAVLDIISTTELPFPSADLSRHDGCRWCDFRKGQNDHPGCWQTYFVDETIKKPARHIHELVGHGNQSQSGNGVYFQEQAEIQDGLDSFDKMQKFGGPSITIQQRRNLQILQAGDHETPLLWIKPGIRKMDELEYPLHFIDFEAATYALPFKRGMRPYEPVYFQFSCHTLETSGIVHHTEWIDLDPHSPDPHIRFTDEISRIPGILHGTLIQFSPFERQGINNLINTFKKNSMLYPRQIEILETIRRGKNREYQHRFFDINELIRSYYYNCFLTKGLGLKQVFGAVKMWEKKYSNKESVCMANVRDFNETHEYDSAIFDGSSAMNAWISLKNGLLTPGEESFIPDILSKYCTLDSYALLYLYKHLQKFGGMADGSDFVIFEGSLSK